MVRDFTYVDDVAEGIIRAADKPATPDPLFAPALPNPCTSFAPYRIFNLGNHQPVPLMACIEALEQALGRDAIKNYQPMQPGDVVATSASVDELHAWLGFRPATPLATGIERFVRWYREDYEKRLPV